MKSNIFFQPGNTVKLQLLCNEVFFFFSSEHVLREHEINSEMKELNIRKPPMILTLWGEGGGWDCNA